MIRRRWLRSGAVFGYHADHVVLLGPFTDEAKARHMARRFNRVLAPIVRVLRFAGVL